MKNAAKDKGNDIFKHNDTVVVDDATIGYHGRVVLRNVNAHTRRGELTCVIGDNGTGKSTLLRSIAALQPCMCGSILVCGHNIGDTQRQTVSRLMSVVLTERVESRRLTVENTVALGRTPYTNFWGALSENDQTVINEAMNEAGIVCMKDRLMGSLSDGEAQKVMIAKALAQQTPVIILDEPTAFLDFKSKVDTMRRLRELAHDKDKTILLATHDIEIALQTADHLWLVSHDGLAEGGPHELAESCALSNFFDHDGVKINTQTLEIKFIR